MRARSIRSFARTWTVDLQGRNIRCNVISPGTIDTGIFVGVPKEVKDRFVSLIPMRRIGQPQEIAKAALFLASDDFSFSQEMKYLSTAALRKYRADYS